MRPPADPPPSTIPVCPPSLRRELQTGGQPPPLHAASAPSRPPSLSLLSHLPFSPPHLFHPLHEYLKASTRMQNMQQGQWRLGKEEKEKCSFRDSECLFLGVSMSSPITEGEIYKDRLKQKWRERQTGLRDADPSYSCPAGERSGG